MSTTALPADGQQTEAGQCFRYFYSSFVCFEEQFQVVSP
jgi:hypothetical protein